MAPEASRSSKLTIVAGAREAWKNSRTAKAVSGKQSCYSPQNILTAELQYTPVSASPIRFLLRMEGANIGGKTVILQFAFHRRNYNTPEREMPNSPNEAKPASGKAAPKKKKTWSLPDLPKNATKASIPPTFKPQLATLPDGPPNDPNEWAYEIKFDGYRILARIEEKKIQLFTRNGNDWSHKLPDIEKAIAAMDFQSGWLDGEVVVSNDIGVPDFQALQNAFDSSRTRNILYFLIDVPFYAGFDFRAAPLTERREFLKGLFGARPSKKVHFSQTFDVPAKDIIASAWSEPPCARKVGRKRYHFAWNIAMQIEQTMDIA